MLDEYADVIAKMENVEEIIADDLKFRHKLGIGEDAYRGLKAVSNLRPVAAGVAGATVASSPVVASTFFGGTAASVAGWLGLGLTATTPVGWVIAGALAGGGAYVGYSKLREKWRKRFVDEAPTQTNAPLNVLAQSVIEFLMPVAFRLALSDGNLDDRERRKIKEYFVNAWGYSESFADRNIKKFQKESDLIELEELFSALEEFKTHDKDCNFDHIFGELLEFLDELANVDGEFHVGEKATIAEVKSLLGTYGLLPS